MVSELIGRSVIELDFCRHSPFHIAHRSGENGELPISGTASRPIIMSKELTYLQFSTF